VVIQRFGGALNLNVHFHALVPDGVFAGEPGTLAFHRIGRLTALDAEEVLAAVEPLVDRRLRAPTATASTQAPSFRPGSVSGWSGCAGTSCVRRW